MFSYPFLEGAFSFPYILFVANLAFQGINEVFGLAREGLFRGWASQRW
jgi:hypothetical protein